MAKNQLHPRRAQTEQWLNDVYRRIDQAVAYLREKLKGRKHVSLIILGSGLGEGLRDLHDKITILYENIPNFPISTAPGHAGKLVSGRLGKKFVLVMMGRPHLYEGYSMEDIALPIRVAYLLGVRNLVITNACGALRKDLAEADIVLIKDHINLMCANPLVGPNLDRFGVRFPDIHEPYDRQFLAGMQQVAQRDGIEVKTGVHTAIPGPTYETPAEMRYLLGIGAHTTGMSTILECIIAKHCTKAGPMRVLGMSIVTDICDPDNPRVLTEEDVLRVARKASPRVGKLISQFVQKVL